MSSGSLPPRFNHRSDHQQPLARRVKLVDYPVTEPEKTGPPLTLKRFGKHRCQQNEVGIHLVQLRPQPFIIELAPLLDVSIHCIAPSDGL